MSNVKTIETASWIDGVDRRLEVMSPAPLVLSTPVPLLGEHRITPKEYLFIRNIQDLAEGIYTLMTAGEVAADWRKVAVVHAGVSSFVGRGVWDKVWDAPACAVARPAPASRSAAPSRSRALLRPTASR